MRIAIVICAALALSACGGKPKIETRVSFILPPADKRVCPDDPPPPGKPGQIVSEAEDYAWQERRDIANGECRAKLHWFDKFFDYISKNYPTTTLAIPNM